jgi:hypothetical protein
LKDKKPKKELIYEYIMNLLSDSPVQDKLNQPKRKAALQINPDVEKEKEQKVRPVLILINYLIAREKAKVNGKKEYPISRLTSEEKTINKTDWMANIT